MIKLQTGFSHITVNGISLLGTTVGTNLGANPIWGSLQPTGTDVMAATGVYDSARNMHGPGRKQALQAARQSLVKLLADVAMNAPQVKAATDTDLAQIGLRVLQKPGPKNTQPPEKCEDLQVRHGELPGTVNGKCKAQGRDVRFYEGQWTLDPMNGSWSDIETFPNSREFEWSNLARGKDTWFRVRGRNIVGAGPWSDPVSIMVT